MLELASRLLEWDGRADELPTRKGVSPRPREPTCTSNRFPSRSRRRQRPRIGGNLAVRCRPRRSLAGGSHLGVAGVDIGSRCATRRTTGWGLVVGG